MNIKEGQAHSLPVVARCGSEWIVHDVEGEERKQIRVTGSGRGDGSKFGDDAVINAVIVSVLVCLPNTKSY